MAERMPVGRGFTKGVGSILRRGLEVICDLGEGSFNSDGVTGPVADRSEWI